MQSGDKGIHPTTDKITTTSGKHVNMILIVQFKYAKILCYYIVSMSVLVSFRYFFYVFDAGFCKGHLPCSRWYQTFLEARGIHWWNCTNLICTIRFAVVFFHEYIHLVYIMLSIFDAACWSRKSPGYWSDDGNLKETGKPDCNCTI